MAGRTNPRPASDLAAVLSPLNRDVRILTVPRSLLSKSRDVGNVRWQPTASVSSPRTAFMARHTEIQSFSFQLSTANSMAKRVFTEKS
jgi:hypothetical protein